jgi:hypothetical protein
MSGERPQRGGYPAGDVTASELAERGILPSAPMTEEQVTEFRERFAAAVKQPGAHELRFLSRGPLSRDEVRSLLRECVTVVKPGETLIIRGQPEWTPVQVREVQDALNSIREDGNLPFRAIVVPGAELGVTEAGDG